MRKETARLFLQYVFGHLGRNTIRMLALEGRIPHAEDIGRDDGRPYIEQGEKATADFLRKVADALDREEA